VQHSEFNNSRSRPVHFLQIWIKPDVAGIAPEYEEKRFETEHKRGRLRLIASPDGTAGSVRIHQDARVFAGLFDGAEQQTLTVEPTRRIYVHIARGRVSVNGELLEAGDALAAEGIKSLELMNGTDAEVLMFDLGGAAH
jgi:redox-sensitive bicupin YhaK (pirin superfamily)